MSARYLKKVLKEQEQQQMTKLADYEIEEDQLNVDDESESPNSSAPPSKNPFDLLNDGDDDDHDQEIDSENAEDTFIKNNYSKETPLVKKDTVDEVPISHRKSKKKKKKKNMDGSLPSTNKGEEALDVILESLSFDHNSSSHQPGSTKGKASNVKVRDNVVKQCSSSLLQVDPKFLSAENELRRIFGSKVVSSFETNNQTGSSRQMRGGRRGGHNTRKTILVSPSEHWHRWDGSLSMELLETKDGYHYFRYVHSPAYSQMQRDFEAAKANNEFDRIAGIIAYHPYHLDSLITLAEYFQYAGEHQQASDYIAQCLYASECAWHPMFTPLQGNCKLKVCHDTNKPFLKALFIHMKNMDRRGCHRCALEVCKLLLSLDSDDPMGAKCCIDYFSLRAEQYTWLEQFSNSDDSLWLFPNFSYSLAICRFYIEQNNPSNDADKETTKATSIDLMKQALLLHPLVLKQLVAKVPLKDQVFANVIKHAYFKSDDYGNPSLDHLTKIYITRSYIIWRLPDLQKLLKDSAKLVIETLEQNSGESRDWACVRKEAFPLEKNEYAHLMISDFSDSMPTIPPENLQHFMVAPRMGVAANPPGNDHVPRDVANRNPLAVLFESMLPWVDYGGREDAGAVGEDNQHNGHDQVNGDH